MKNNLHIFGCSHSTFDKDFIGKRIQLNSETKFWGETIATNFNINLFERTGQTGRNVEYILFDIFDRILSNQIQKNDLIILNTSYPLRFGTPRLQSYSKHPMDNNVDIKPHLNITFDDIESLDDLKPEITFIIWYVQTFGAWKLLSSICDNVYQWCLSDTTEMDEFYIKCKSFFSDESTKELYSKILGIDKYDVNDIIKSNYLNPWNNLIVAPSNFISWNDFICSHPIDKTDLHLHPNYYNEFAKLFIEQINYSND